MALDQYKCKMIPVSTLCVFLMIADCWNIIIAFKMERKNTKKTPIGSYTGDSDKFYYSRKCQGSERNVLYIYSISNFPDYRLSFRQQRIE